MDEYKSNSHKSKQKETSLPEKKVEKVVVGKAKSKKKSGVAKFTDIFISEDIENVKDYIIMDIVIPAVVNAIEDVVVNGTRMILRGDRGKSKTNYNSSKVSYKSYSNYKNEPKRKANINSFDYDEVVFESIRDAESVLFAMEDIIEQYGFVTVADFYDLANVTTNNYTTNKYGWDDIRSGKAVRVRDGYILKLPKPIKI